MQDKKPVDTYLHTDNVFVSLFQENSWTPTGKLEVNTKIWAKLTSI